MKSGHLTLTRAEGQAVQVGDDVLVEVVWCRNGQVQLRFTAPTHLKIMRSELLGKEPKAVRK